MLSSARAALPARSDSEQSLLRRCYSLPLSRVTLTEKWRRRSARVSSESSRQGGRFLLPGRRQCRSKCDKKAMEISSPSCGDRCWGELKGRCRFVLRHKRTSVLGRESSCKSSALPCCHACRLDPVRSCSTERKPIGQLDVGNNHLLLVQTNSVRIGIQCQ